jgi:ubiquinone/menaquinone biosynthesis C-methylase UbiE
VAKPFDYALGYTEQEAKRLQWQAALSEDILEDGLRRAGISAGMRVLDLGSGVGDVALALARFVGAEGSVLGVERWEPSIEVARRRCKAQDLANVSFVQGVLEEFEPEGRFDAIVGRFILQYLPTRSAILARLKRRLNPGGVMLFQEIDNSGSSEAPPSPLFGEVRGWIASAFAATGSVFDMGALLARTFLEAGLPRPQMIGVTRVESGPDTPYYEFLTEVLRSVLPVLQRDSAPPAEAIDIDTLAERLRADAVENERTLYASRIVSAWATVT